MLHEKLRHSQSWPEHSLILHERIILGPTVSQLTDVEDFIYCSFQTNFETRLAAYEHSHGKNFDKAT